MIGDRDEDEISMNGHNVLMYSSRIPEKVLNFVMKLYYAHDVSMVRMAEWSALSCVLNDWRS